MVCGDDCGDIRFQFTIYKRMTIFMKKTRLISSLCVAALGLSVLAGCNSSSSNTSNKSEKTGSIATQSDTKGESSGTVMTVGEYEIGKDELMLYSILEILSGTVQYEEIQEDEEKYKQVVIDNLVEAKMAGDAAGEANMEFTKDDEDTRDSLIKNFTSYVTQDVRDKYGISDELIDSVFQDTSVMNKIETNSRNELGKKLTADNQEKYKDYNFQKIYYITFPKVKADDNGDPMVDDDGNYVKLDDKGLADMKAKAEAAVKEINDGADAKETAKKYGVDTYSEESQSYVGAYTDDMNDVMDKLTAGKCTEVYDTETSYYAIAVLSDHDSDLLQSFAYQAALADVDTELEKKKQEWINSCDDKGGIVYKDDTWKNFSLLDMATYLNDKGLMK